MAAALPALIPLLAIFVYGIDFPFWDQWDPGLSGMFIKAGEHQLGFGDIWAQHNEHRIFVPKVVFLILSQITGWNTIYEMLAGWVCACVTSAGIYVLIRRTFGEGLFLWFLSNLCVFSLAQWENWLGGVGMINVMGVMWAVGTVVVASSSIDLRWRVPAAILCAMAATFTCGSGVICWGQALLLLAWSDSVRELKAKRWALAGWLGAMVLTLVLFTYGYKPGPGGEATGIWVRITFLVGFLGSCFGPVMAIEWSRAATFIGTLMLGLYLAVLGYFIHTWQSRRDPLLCRRMLGWIALGGYSLVGGALAALMRASSDSSQPTSSRYSTFAIPLAISLVNLVPLICKDLAERTTASDSLQRLWVRIPVAGATLLIWLQISLTAALVPFIETTTSTRYVMKAAILLSGVMPHNPWLRPPGFPEYPGMEDRIRQLSQLGYLHPPMFASGNAEAIRSPQSLSAGESEQWGKIEQVQLSGDRTTLIARGWAVSHESAGPAQAVILTMDDWQRQPTIVALGIVNEPRPEVSTRLGNARVLGSGWTITCPMPSPQSGLAEVRLSAWALNTDTGKAFRLGKPVVIGR